MPPPDAAPLVVEASGSYAFHLVDREGLEGGDDAAWELRAVPDRPPTATLHVPAADLYVTPQAVLPVRVSAHDDLALRRVSLVLTPADGAPPQEKTLYAGPQKPPPPAGDWADAAAKGDRRPFDDRWALQPLGLTPGTQATLYATAIDYRGQAGKSEVRRLTVVTPQELRDRVAGRQTLVLAELERVLKMQQSGRAQVAAVEKQLAGTKPPEPSPVNQLRAAELTQREVNRSLTSPGEGVRMHVLALLADLGNNGVDSPDVQRRMEHILAEIERLERDHLPAIERQLTAAVKSFVAGESADRSPQARSGLSAQPGRRRQEPGRGHRHASATPRPVEPVGEPPPLLPRLGAVAPRPGAVGRADGRAGAAHAHPGDRRSYAATNRRPGRIGRIAATAHAAARPHRAGHGTGRAGPAQERSAGGRHGRRGPGRVPPPGHQRRDAVLRRRPAPNRLGQIVGTQGRGLHKQIAQNLQEVLDILADRRQHELKRLIPRLQEAEAELTRLAEQQDGLLKQVAEAAAETDAAKRLALFQEIVRQLQLRQQEAEDLARRLERLEAERPAKSVSDAAAQMNAAAQAAGRSELERLREQLEAARKSVEDARRQLAEERLQAQSDSLMDELARLEDAAKHLHRQQQRMLGRHAPLRRAAPGQRATQAERGRGSGRRGAIAAHVAGRCRPAG